MSRRTLSPVRQYCRALLGLLVGGLALVVPATAAERITVYYYERTPYSVTAEDGNVSGLIIDPTRTAFERAGIPFAFEAASTNRILELLVEEAGAACSPGWYRTDARARLAKFTDPIYRDTPPIGLVSKSVAVPPGTRAADLLAGDVRLVMTDGFVYGDYLDPLIARKDPRQVLHLPRPLRGAIEMVLAGHADLALVTEEDAQAYAKDGIGGPDYPILHFPDVPSGNTRHIMCSRGVPDETIERLNRVIEPPR